MTTKDSSEAKKLNFFTSAFLGIMGLSLAQEIIMEDDPVDKIDDLAFLLLGLFAVYWYRKNPTKFSLMPVILVLVGTLIKIGAILVEMNDKEAVGDDIGILVALIITLVFVFLQYRKLKQS